MHGKAVIQYLSAAIILASPSKYHVLFSKPRNGTSVAVRAFIRERMTPWTPLSNDGTAFREPMLERGGWLWALKGTGDRKTAAVA